jgi:processive 1,2-diacylglycerol beta-glucosyltransferase
MSHRVLILTAGFGEGHNAAARALAAGFARNGDANTARIIDAFELASPRFNRLARNVYLTLINRAPQLWSRVYDWIDHSRLNGRRLWIFRKEIRVLATLLAQENPAVLCCTYPLYAFLLEALAAAGYRIPPVYNVVTDSISIHSLWWRAPCSGWFLPNEDSASVLRNAGIPAERIFVYGFPVPAFFADNLSTLSPPAFGPGVTPRVLHIINSGTRHAEATAKRLLTETNWEITCAVGRDTALQARLQDIVSRRPYASRVLGWTDQIPHLLMTHHAVVSKAGGATTQESIAALCPMIVSQVVPGQEEGNFELLRRHRAGARAETPDEVVQQLRRAFADNGRIWREWRAALRPIARPDAAGDIARHLLARTLPGPLARVNSPHLRANNPHPSIPALTSTAASSTISRPSPSALPP